MMADISHRRLTAIISLTPGQASTWMANILTFSAARDDWGGSEGGNRGVIHTKLQSDRHQNANRSF